MINKCFRCGRTGLDLIDWKLYAMKENKCVPTKKVKICFDCMNNKAITN